jgi:hypothetical protein
MSPGNVIAINKEDSIVIFSKKHIADLAIEIWQPAALVPQIKKIQLIGGITRVLSANTNNNRQL